MKSLICTLLLCVAISFVSCAKKDADKISQIKINQLKDSSLNYLNYVPTGNELVISRSEYKNKLYGFWLGQCIANWTGLVTEMDKIGNIGEFQTGDFYTREDWGSPDQPSIWGEGVPSDLSDTIDFVFETEDGIWGADDDTDIEYMYQHLMFVNKVSILSPEQIREGWLKHIRSEEENYLWVSNQTALDLMIQGMLPPQTSHPENNENYMMIDAQLTTEIFGFFAPGRPDLALKMAYLPIRTTAREDAAWISEFYVSMYSLASATDQKLPLNEQLKWMAEQSAKRLPDESYALKMFEFVKNQYESGIRWEEARDAVYQRYQVEQQDGYNLTSKELYCNACFAAGINFASSIVSLYYGEGDIQETIKIAVLSGWDSDNPAATWGGLLGFMLGKEGVESAFDKKFSNRFNIHRTRQNFPNDGIDTFENMAEKGVFIVDRVIQEEIEGGIDLNKNLWYVPHAETREHKKK